MSTKLMFSRNSEVRDVLVAKTRTRISDYQLSRYLSELVEYGFAIKTEGTYVLADPMIKYALGR